MWLNNNQISGSGKDLFGDFSISGVRSNFEILFKQAYANGSQILYSGTIDDALKVVSGNFDDGSNKGPFKLSKYKKKVTAPVQPYSESPQFKAAREFVDEVIAKGEPFVD